jgi:hypothetical protein
VHRTCLLCWTQRIFLRSMPWRDYRRSSDSRPSVRSNCRMRRSFSLSAAAALLLRCLCSLFRFIFQAVVAGLSGPIPPASLGDLPALHPFLHDLPLLFRSLIYAWFPAYLASSSEALNRTEFGSLVSAGSTTARDDSQKAIASAIVIVRSESCGAADRSSVNCGRVL